MFIVNPLCLLTTTGVRRLLFKVMHTGRKDLFHLAQRLHNLTIRPQPRGDTMGALGHHIAKFRSVSREFAINWPSGKSTMFTHKAPHVFGIAKAIRIWVSLNPEFTRKTQLYAFMMGQVQGMDNSAVKRILNGVPNNCGETICRVSTMVDFKTNTQRKVVVPTQFTTRFVGVRSKRRRSGSSSEDSDVALAAVIPATRSRAPAPATRSSARV